MTYGEERFIIYELCSAIETHIKILARNLDTNPTIIITFNHILLFFHGLGASAAIVAMNSIMNSPNKHTHDNKSQIAAPISDHFSLYVIL
jgi:hypothetical protein